MKTLKKPEKPKILLVSKCSQYLYIYISKSHLPVHIVCSDRIIVSAMPYFSVTGHSLQDECGKDDSLVKWLNRDCPYGLFFLRTF